MRTLYIGHVTLWEDFIYSFIYAETLGEAEEYLTDFIKKYVREQYSAAALFVLPKVRIVSRPNGWTAPDGLDLPATSTQYKLKYSSRHSVAVEESRIHSLSGNSPNISFVETVTSYPISDESKRI